MPHNIFALLIVIILISFPVSEDEHFELLFESNGSELVVCTMSLLPNPSLSSLSLRACFRSWGWVVYTNR